jgi:hypothetical protein
MRPRKDKPKSLPKIKYSIAEPPAPVADRIRFRNNRRRTAQLAACEPEEVKTRFFFHGTHLLRSLYTFRRFSTNLGATMTTVALSVRSTILILTLHTPWMLMQATIMLWVVLSKVKLELNRHLGESYDYFRSRGAT